MIDDAELLRRYTDQSSEEAFTELVRRHAEMVYSAAFRRLAGDVHLVQDVTQSVFTDLARKASSLAGRRSLAGWLYTSACFAASKVVRAEQRRRTREQEAETMTGLLRGTASGLDWARVRPLLDEAMLRLSEQDREAVLCRFFEKSPYADLGKQLGLSQNAARMRVSRALDELRNLLAARGLTTTASALAFVLTARASQGLPIGLHVNLARTALAAAGATTTSMIGFFAFMASTSFKTALIAIGGLAIIGAVTITIHKSSTSDKKANNPLEAPRPSAVTSSSSALNRSTRGPRIVPASDPNSSLESLLARVQGVMNDPAAQMRLPNPAMQEVVDALGERRKAAVAILRDGLKDQRQFVRARAADGLMMIGSDAKEASTDLLEVLRATVSTQDQAADASIRALARIAPEILPDLARLLKDNPLARARVAESGMSIGFEAICASIRVDLVEATVRPLLEDTDVAVRSHAAQSLSYVLKGQSDRNIIRAGIDALNSGDDCNRQLGLATLRNVGWDPFQPSRASVTEDSLGLDVRDAIAALVEAASKTQRQDIRDAALRLLTGLNPDLRQESPELQAFFQEHQQVAELNENITSGKAGMREIIEGLNQFPKAVPDIADTLALLGNQAKAALPALRKALVELEPRPEASARDRVSAHVSRQRIANAIQRIAPDEPKPFFTMQDTRSILDTVLFLTTVGDAARREKLEAAVEPVLAEVKYLGPEMRGYVFELSPEQVRRLLNEVNAADKHTYESVAAQVKAIDPHFSFERR